MPDFAYPLSAPDSVSPTAIDAAIASLRSGRYTMGPQVQAFERAFAQWVGSTHAVMVNSGSSANLLAVEALMRPFTGRRKWLPKDEVLVPALAWPTTVWPLVQLGLTPVFCDVDPQTLALDWTDARSRLTDNTVGAVLIHVMGLAADLMEAQAFCVSRELTLIEDACEAFGAHSRGLSVGTAGYLGTFSHYFAHQLTTIEGGTVVTNDDGVADDLRSMRAHGWTRNRSDRALLQASVDLDPSFLFVTTGYNVRPMDLQGAIGVEQLAQADAALERRDWCVRVLASACADTPWLEIIGLAHLSPADTTDRTTRRHSWMNVPMRVTPESPVGRRAILAHLHRCGVETRPIIAGNLTKHPVMRSLGIPAQDFPVADALMDDGFMVGCHPHGLDRLCEAMRSLDAAVAA